MKKTIIFVLIITIFTNCSKDEIEVDPALEFISYQLTSFGMDYNPVLSPDTEHIVYLSIRYQYERYLQNMNSGQRLTDLWIMDRYGGTDWRIFKREEMEEGFKLFR